MQELHVYTQACALLISNRVVQHASRVLTAGSEWREPLVGPMTALVVAFHTSPGVCAR